MTPFDVDLWLLVLRGTDGDAVFASHTREQEAETTMHTMSDTSPVMTERAAAQYLSVSPAYLTLSRRRSRRQTVGPPYIRIGRRMVRYLRADLDQFLEARRAATPKEAA